MPICPDQIGDSFRAVPVWHENFEGVTLRNSVISESEEFFSNIPAFTDTHYFGMTLTEVSRTPNVDTYSLIYLRIEGLIVFTKYIVSTSMINSSPEIVSLVGACLTLFYKFETAVISFIFFFDFFLS